MAKYDIIMIGGGAGGFAAATKASELGAKAVIINGGLPIGGTCVNVGCVPSKILLEVGSELYNSQHPRFKAVRNEPSSNFDFETAIGEKDELVASLRQSNYIRIAAELKIPVIEGRARFISPQQIEVAGQTLEADKFIIATGSRPRILPFKGVDKVTYITNREALSLSRLPESMIVIGAGPIGLEFAQMYARFGTKVTVLEKEKQILPLAEPEIANELQRCLEEEGIEIHTGVDIEELGEAGNLKIVTARIGKKPISVRGEQLLLATGVAPNSNDMGLELAGVKVSQRGFIEVDENLRTSAPHIWAAGDVVGKTFLETVAAKEGYIAAGNALEGTKKAIDYDSVPKAVFTDPQVASVGITEEEEMRRLNTCACRTLEIALVPKAMAIKETRGLVKMAIHPETQVILGVHMVAPMAADLIHEATLAVKYKLTIDDIVDTVHVFPTMSEAIKRVAQSFKRDIATMSCCVE
ncbi:MAG: mercury(II) reductase [Chloroflexi bacterium]|nr:mercury(II) reductase [Chloroflexota bacterium]